MGAVPRLPDHPTGPRSRWASTIPPRCVRVDPRMSRFRQPEADLSHPRPRGTTTRTATPGCQSSSPGSRSFRERHGSRASAPCCPSGPPPHRAPPTSAWGAGEKNPPAAGGAAAQPMGVHEAGQERTDASRSCSPPTPAAAGSRRAANKVSRGPPAPPTWKLVTTRRAAPMRCGLPAAPGGASNVRLSALLCGTLPTAVVGGRPPPAIRLGTPPPLRDRPPQAARERNLTIESANCRAEDDCRRQPPLRAVQLNAHPQVTSSLAATHWPTSLCLGCPGGGCAGTPPSFSRASKGGALGPLRPPNKTKPPLAVVWALERQRSVGGGWATRGRAHSTQRYQAWGRLT